MKILTAIKGVIYVRRATLLLTVQDKFVLLNFVSVLDDNLSRTQQFHGDVTSRINQITQQIEKFENYQGLHHRSLK